MLKGNNWLRHKLKQKQRMGVARFWSECGVQLISYLCASIIMTMVLSVTVKVSTERLTRIVEYCACGLAVLWCIPIIRNTRFRLRDAGYTAKSYLWLLLPIVGWIIFIARLFAKSAEQKPNEVYAD